jgi:hypothetical protein
MVIYDDWLTSATASGQTKVWHNLGVAYREHRSLVRAAGWFDEALQCEKGAVSKRSEINEMFEI